LLDPRIYRACLVPIVFAAVIAAFSFGNQPRGLDTTLAPDAFNPARARATLDRLAKEFPNRKSGSSGDRGLATESKTVFTKLGFETESTTKKELTAAGVKPVEVVTATKTGISDRKLVVVAARDSDSAPAKASLSSSAALLELAEVFRRRKLQKTLVLISTSGSVGGQAGTDRIKDQVGSHVDAVIALGDIASPNQRRPVAVTWSQGAPHTPPGVLEKTLRRALRDEGVNDPGSPTIFAQIARLSAPLTPSYQGELLRVGLPAVMLQATGERPSKGNEVSNTRLSQYGRAVVRTVSAFDSLKDASQVSVGQVLNVEQKSMPAWSMRLFVLTLLLSPLVTSLSAVFKLSRDGVRVARWFGWVLLTTVPFVAGVVTVLLLGLFKLFPGAIAAPLTGEGFAVTASYFWVLAVVLLTGALAWVILRRPLLKSLGIEASQLRDQAALAVVTTASVAVFLFWFVNPYAALLLTPLAHVVALSVPDRGRFQSSQAGAVAAIGVVTASILLPLLVATYYMVVLKLTPLEFFAQLTALTAGGAFSAIQLVLGLFLVGALVGLCLVYTLGADRPDRSNLIKGEILDRSY